MASATPKSNSGSANVASSVASTPSAAAATPTPPPIASPSTKLTTGLGAIRIMPRHAANSSMVPVGSLPLDAAPKSRPRQKTPASLPRSTTTRESSPVTACCSAARNAWTVGRSRPQARRRRPRRSAPCVLAVELGHARRTRAGRGRDRTGRTSRRASRAAPRSRRRRPAPGALRFDRFVVLDRDGPPRVEPLLERRGPGQRPRVGANAHAVELRAAIPTRTKTSTPDRRLQPTVAVDESQQADERAGRNTCRPCGAA